MGRTLGVLSGLLLVASLAIGDIKPPPDPCLAGNLTVSDMSLSWTWDCASHCWRLDATATATYNCGSGNQNGCRVCYRWHVENTTYPSGVPGSFAYDTSGRTSCGKRFRDDVAYSVSCLESGQEQEVWMAVGPAPSFSFCDPDSQPSYTHFVSATTILPDPPVPDPCF